MTTDSKYPVVSGFDHVSDTDLVAQITGVDPGDAGEALDRVGGIRHLATAELAILADMPGLGPVTAKRLLAAVELGRRLEAAPLDQKSFVSSTDVARYFMPRLRDLRKEVFITLLLDARNCLIRGVTISVGSLTASIVHPREVFRPAILDSAASVIFLHNHPSGDPRRARTISRSPRSWSRRDSCSTSRCWIISSSAAASLPALPRRV